MTPKQAKVLLLTAIVTNKLLESSDPKNLLCLMLSNAIDDMVEEFSMIGIPLDHIETGPMQV